MARGRPIRARTARTVAARYAAKGRVREGSKTDRKLKRQAAARGRMPAPGTAAARGQYERWAPDNEETRFLRRAAMQVSLDKRHKSLDNPYLDELRQLGEERYRAAYNAQQRERKAARPAKPKAPKGWTWVRRHKRRIARR